MTARSSAARTAVRMKSGSRTRQITFEGSTVRLRRRRPEIRSCHAGTAVGFCRVASGDNASRAANQKDYTIRLQQYFDHVLKGAPAPEWTEKGVPYIGKDRTALLELGRP